MTQTLTEKLNDDDYYLVHTPSKKVVKNLGSQSIPFGTKPSDHPRLKQHITSTDHNVLSGMRARMGGFTSDGGIKECKEVLVSRAPEKASAITK